VIHDLEGQSFCDNSKLTVYVPSKSVLVGLGQPTRLERIALPRDTTQGVQGEKHQDSLRVKDQEKLETMDKS